MRIWPERKCKQAPNFFFMSNRFLWEFLREKLYSRVHKSNSPVPGAPYKMTPFGGFIPISSYNSGCVRGNSTDSYTRTEYKLLYISDG